MAITILYFSSSDNAKQCCSRSVSITNAVNTASQSEPAKSKLWQCPHLINSGITIIFNNCIVYLENLPQCLNKLVWKPPWGLTSKILTRITITSAQMSPVIDICIICTSDRHLHKSYATFINSCFSSYLTSVGVCLFQPSYKTQHSSGQPCSGARGAPQHKGQYLIPKSKNLIANHFSWPFRLRSKQYWVVSWILWGQCLSPRVQWLKLCLAGGSYVAFLQGAGNPYSAAGMCLPHKSPAALAASLAGSARRPRAEQTRCLCWNATRWEWGSTGKPVLSHCVMLLVGSGATECWEPRTSNKSWFPLQERKQQPAPSVSFGTIVTIWVSVQRCSERHSAFFFSKAK